MNEIYEIKRGRLWPDLQKGEVHGSTMGVRGLDSDPHSRGRNPFHGTACYLDWNTEMLHRFKSGNFASAFHKGRVLI